MPFRDLDRRRMYYRDYRPVRGSSLSPRETYVLEQIANGYKQSQIAAHLNVAEGTIGCYVTSARHKLHASTAAEAAVKFALSKAKP